jgi:DNA invertase Pin-like site-specific DNA recombinase
MAIIAPSVPLRAAIYVRSATLAQGDEGRLEKQAATCRRLAENVGADVIAEYRDVGFGASSYRPGLQAMLDAARRRDLDVVLCERPDRLARGAAKLHGIEGKLECLGVTVRYAADDPSSSCERRALTAALASLEAPMRVARDEEV